MIDRVTMTGPDDHTDPRALFDLSQEFPFVEWGILVSASQSGKSPRFPGFTWIERLLEHNYPLKLSLHMCGRWVREVLKGQVSFGSISEKFHRTQLNFHAENTECDPEQFFEALLYLGSGQYIFQIDGNGGNAHLDALWDRIDLHNSNMSAVPLFDISGGAGILPTEWPKPQWMQDDSTYCYHGYAGGLGPDNLATEIPRILTAAGPDCPRIWIDMETKVRTDEVFDLAKVRKCLEIAKPYVRGVQ